MTVDDVNARRYYERETLRGGWSVRELDRQIASVSYHRTARTKAARSQIEPGSAEVEIRDPFVLEFLNLKDSIRSPIWRML